MVLIPKFNEHAKNLLKVEDVTTTGPIFSLHCKLTAVLLFFACGMLTMKQLVGEPIQCISDFKEKDRNKVLSTFCWIHSTFTVPGGTSSDDNMPDALNSTGEKTYHAYYQWVCFVLFFQGLAFYVPQWIWEKAENGLMNHLKSTDTLSKQTGKEKKANSPAVAKLLTKAEHEEKKTILVNYFMERLKTHTEYTMRYWLCEFLCLVNVIAQALLIDKFLDGRGTFFKYGLNAINSPESEFSNSTAPYAMDRVFPMRTKCTFHTVGPTGLIQPKDALCVLALNNYNRYIYLIMWFWFLLLIILLTALLVYRIALVLSPRLRNVLLRMPAIKNSRIETEFVVRNLEVTDWWVLYVLKSNVDPILFKDMITELFQKLSFQKPRNIVLRNLCRL